MGGQIRLSYLALASLGLDLSLCFCSVYDEARSQRVLSFKNAGFRIRAAVIVLPDSSLFRRQRKQHQEEGKTVPEATIADMRGMLKVKDPDNKQHFQTLSRLECTYNQKPFRGAAQAPVPLQRPHHGRCSGT